MPTRDNPLTDAVTAASPKGDFHLTTKTPQDLLKFVVLAEINNSTDFNDAYPKNATRGTPNYTGGSWGQRPALGSLCAATVDLTSGPGTWELAPVGHGSPDGTDAVASYPDLTGLTTAKDIVRTDHRLDPIGFCPFSSRLRAFWCLVESSHRCSVDTDDTVAAQAARSPGLMGNKSTIQPKIEAPIRPLPPYPVSPPFPSLS